MEQQHGGGLAHHRAPADDHRLLAGAVNAVVVQNLHAGGGGAGGEAQGLAHEHAGVGAVGHAVHVLAGIQTVADLVLVRLQVLGQGAEHEHAVDLVVGVDAVDDFQKVPLGHVLGQDELLHRHAQGLRPLGGATLIAEIVGPLAAADDGQGGLYAPGLQGLAVGNDAGVELLVDFFS